MKRPHRRIHFLVWLVIAPATAVAGVLFWQTRPETPYADLPAVLEADAEREAN